MTIEKKTYMTVNKTIDKMLSQYAIVFDAVQTANLVYA